MTDRIEGWPEGVEFRPARGEMVPIPEAVDALHLRVDYVAETLERVEEKLDRTLDQTRALVTVVDNLARVLDRRTS